MALGVTVTFACSVGFVCFVIPIVWSHPLLMSLMNFRFQQNHVSHHLIIKQIATMLEF